MARFIDDQVLANINSIIYFKSQEIVTYVFSTRAILQDLLHNMRNNDDIQFKNSALDFFMEVC